MDVTASDNCKLANCAQCSQPNIKARTYRLPLNSGRPAGPTVQTALPATPSHNGCGSCSSPSQALVHLASAAAVARMTAQSAQSVASAQQSACHPFPRPHCCCYCCCGCCCACVHCPLQRHGHWQSCCCCCCCFGRCRRGGLGCS